MKLFHIPFVEPQHEEAVYARISKSVGATVPERRLRALFYTEGGRNRSATVGKPFRRSEQTVTTILPKGGGYVVTLSPPDGPVRGGIVKVAPAAVLSTKHFDAPAGDMLRAAITNAEIVKRHAARRTLFAKVQQLADSKQIPWEAALRHTVLAPENIELLKCAQEPRRQRRARQRLTDAELEKRMQQLEQAVGGPPPDDDVNDVQQLIGTDDIRKTTGTEQEVTPVRKADGTIDEVATEIKKIHKTGGVRVRHRS
jgi:hypothetical protein